MSIECFQYISLCNILCFDVDSGVAYRRPIRKLFVSYNLFTFFCGTVNKMELLFLDTVCSRQ